MRVIKELLKFCLNMVQSWMHNEQPLFLKEQYIWVTRKCLSFFFNVMLSNLGIITSIQHLYWQHRKVTRILLNFFLKIMSMSMLKIKNLKQHLKKQLREITKDIVELLLEQGAIIDTQKSQFHRLFEQAAMYGHNKFIEISLNHCINDLNTLTQYLKMGFSYATHSGHEDIIEMLLEYSMQHAPANAHQELFGLALNIAATKNCNNIIKLLLKYGADLKSEEENTQKALLQAAMFGHKDTVELLLLNNANVNAQGDDFGTALQAAAYGKHKAIIPLLLDHGADVNANEGYFGTALVSYNQQDIVSLLIDHGADINAHDKYQRTPLQIAISHHHHDMAQLLIKYGADESMM
ncbi:ankyrin repeat-containing domain protein [Lentinula raphanica]|uniref:Ankyrin repeat-containing domain protein n=1 Tax=Lentinula raphanica TaxID=153919 RepID=A0AA38P8D9_9AGAR|nr:ankyrin repeat-containing domain protein [Lentinula raphanica]